MSTLKLFLLSFAALLASGFFPPWPFSWWKLLTAERSIFGWLADRIGPRIAGGIVVAAALVLAGAFTLLARLRPTGY